jgi:UDPglucose--hexose-1-phosphate uridylyltransferase
VTQPSLRFDVTTGDWVVFAGGRAGRPVQFAPPQSLRPTAPREETCPFCPGNESSTPPAVDVELNPQRAGAWQVRVFPNRYPALLPEAAPLRTQAGPFFRAMGGHGVHEVVVCSPDHACPIAELPVEQITRLLAVLQRRYRALAADPALEVVQIFENHGGRAGASLQHPHLQIIATPIVPRLVRLKYTMAEEYYQLHGSSLYADLCRAELEAQTRVVVENSEFMVFAPYASRVPYETWIVPRTPAPNFGMASPASLPALARTLQELLQRLHAALGDPAYNLTFFGAPRRHSDEPDFAWHIEVLPRLAIAAGFEFATGMAINSVLPEAAAEMLRETELE